jgi:hypothetical protein
VDLSSETTKSMTSSEACFFVAQARAASVHDRAVLHGI